MSLELTVVVVRAQDIIAQVQLLLRVSSMVELLITIVITVVLKWDHTKPCIEGGVDPLCVK